MADLLADRNDSFDARHASPRWALREGLGSVSQDFRRFGWPISSGEVAGASWFHLGGHETLQFLEPVLDDDDLARRVALRSDRSS